MPKFAPNDPSNRDFVNAIFGSKVHVCELSKDMSPSNRRNISRRKLCAAVSISNRSAAFLVHVLNVFSLRAQKKMVRTAAQFGVALMQNELPLRDLSIGYLPRQSMGRSHFSTEMRDAIAGLLKHRTGPKPATGTFSDLFPKGSNALFSKLRGLLILSWGHEKLSVMYGHNMMVMKCQHQ